MKIVKKTGKKDECSQNHQLKVEIGLGAGTLSRGISMKGNKEKIIKRTKEKRVVRMVN